MTDSMSALGVWGSVFGVWRSDVAKPMSDKSALSRRTSPDRRTRPPWPPKPPRANVDLLSRYLGTSKTPQAGLNRNVGPDIVISNPAASLEFPSNRLPMRNASVSIGPEGGTPTAQ